MPMLLLLLKKEDDFLVPSYSNTEMMRCFLSTSPCRFSEYFYYYEQVDQLGGNTSKDLYIP